MMAINGNRLHVPTSDEHSIHSETETYTEKAKQITAQIKDDKQECQHIISTYAADPNEILHLIGRWTQQEIEEYRGNKSIFKNTMKEKWLNNELANSKTDANNSKMKLILSNYEKLQTDVQATLSIENLNKLNNLFNNNNDDAEEEKRTKLNEFIDQLLEIISLLESIHDYKYSSNNVITTAEQEEDKQSPCHLSNTKQRLLHLKQLNQKEFHTVCVFGLEKCGKSTFINALLGYKFLPDAITRCTQIKTIIKPIAPLKENVFALIEYYNDEEFKRLYATMARKADESAQQFQQ
ncbi:unnamed protein product [Didymodactylos carnosus]|uniref:Dynamin N-terminal domain-containing protein n=2 Tax=Didymodactylos carnosus TaxID=1234261 RepID=A0A8S2HG13_9BILA|nr:unnamed protein product [Didymodactylos carnosus]CAF3642865.1 unnamed protein product [Didymodactylos carnosus]